MLLDALVVVRGAASTALATAVLTPVLQHLGPPPAHVDRVADAADVLRLAREHGWRRVALVLPSSRDLFALVPQLHEWAKDARSIVVHVAAVASAADFAAVQHVAGTVLLSSASSATAEIACDAAFALVVAARAPSVVLHGVCGAPTDTLPKPPLPFDVPTLGLVAREPPSAEALKQLDDLQLRLRVAPTHYVGHTAPAHLIIALDTAAVLAVRATVQNASAPVGLLVLRLFRPLPTSDLLLRLTMPSLRSVRVIDEDVADAWGPLFVDVLSLASGTAEASATPIVPENVRGALSSDDATKFVAAVLAGSQAPVLAAGDATLMDAATAAAVDRPFTNEAVELASPYLKMLAQVLGGRLRVANGVGASTVWGGADATATVGFGRVLAELDVAETAAAHVSDVLRSPDVPLSTALHAALSLWLQSRGDVKRNADAAQTVVRLLDSEHANHAKLEQLHLLHEHLHPRSHWLLGGDVWAHDPGNSGVHGVIASKRKVNMLVLDTAVYSSGAAAGKKDLGLYAMNYGGVYVASISVFASYAQALRALVEADAFSGPAVILAYAPAVRENPQQQQQQPHTSSSQALAVLRESKLAVDQGKWPLYRYDPQQPSAFQLDSDKLRAELKAFVDRENQFSLLVASATPSYAPGTAPAAVEEDLAARHTRAVKQDAAAAFDRLVSGLKGDPLLVLYGSDGGHAEELARRMEAEGKRRGKAVRLMALDECEIDELPNEPNVLVLVSTAGQGEMPSNAREFWKALGAPSMPRLDEVSFAVFALGDSHYWPRPEDKHFFCKAGIDMQRRLEELGAKPLLPCGIGDDQALDGYETSFQAWYPQIWQKLTKEGEIVPQAPAAPTSSAKTPEAIKTVSNFLRGTIAQGLQDESTGALAEEDTVLTKFHGIYQQDDRDLREERRRLKQEKAFSFMVRVRVPGGVCTPAQWLAMDRIADTHANGTIRLTTRQAFQFHGIIKRKLRQSIRDINQVLMDTLAACGDVNRNVMCTPNPFQSHVHQAVCEVARRLSEHLSPRTSAYHEIWLSDTAVAGNAVQDVEPIYGPTYLPRKFKTAIAIPPSNDVDVLAHDLGYIAIVDEHGQLAGFNVTIGGGMGMTHNNAKTFPRLADMLGFCTIEQAIDVGEKVLTVQRDHGDRTNRKHARLKYTVEDHGIDWYRAQVEERLGYKLQPARPFRFDDNADRYGWTRGINDSWHYTFFVQNGRIKDTPDYQLKAGLREIALVHQGDFRLTANQNLIIANVAEAERPTIEQLIEHFKIGTSRHSGLRLNSMACVALPTCGLAFAESERYLPDLVSRIEETLEEAGLRDDAITVRMTGCPNGCARPFIAEIGFVGKAPGVYNMFLGGGFDGNRLNKLFRESVNEDQILADLRPLLRRYAAERNAGEHFGDFVIRAGVVKPVLVASRDFHA